MKMRNKGLKTILEILAFGFVYICFFSIMSPWLYRLLMLMWGIALIYSLYSKYKYQKGNENYLLLPMYNDQYHKVTSLFFGVLYVLASVFLGKYVIEDSVLFLFAGGVLGVLLLLDGWSGSFSGRIEIKNDLLSLNGLKNDIDIHQIKVISLRPDSITVEDIQGTEFRIGNFQLNEKLFTSIENYLSQKASSVEVIRLN